MKEWRLRIGLVGVVLSLLALTATFALSTSRNSIAPPDDTGLSFLIDLQSTDATVTARWTYTPNPEYETWFDYLVEDEAAQSEWLADSTSLMETTFTVPRQAADKAYRFYVRTVIKDALGSIARSDPVDDRFIVPALPAAGLLAKRDMVTSPVIVANDPAFEQERGTIWLEFEPTDDITTSQGLWSRDHNGYQDGGHLTAYIADGSIVVRLQSDSASYVLQWPIVPRTINQAAIEFGEDTGFRLHVNGALAMSDPYTGGTVGNQNDIVVGADKMSYRDTIPDQPWANPFQGTVRVSEFYAGRYDFSGRWGLPPLPIPPPVDSLAIDVANIDHGAVVPLMEWNGQPTQLDYFVVRFTPIEEARWQLVMVNGDTLAARDGALWREALLPVAGGPWKVSQMDSDYGWTMYNEDTGEVCNAPFSGWTVEGTHPCFTREEILAHQERNEDCVGGRYWAKHGSEIECNFNLLISQRASWSFPRGTNPTLRLEVFDANRQRIGYWERSVS